MFSRLIFGKKGESAILEAFLDNSTYEKFKAYVAENSLNESDGMVKILERGMADFWVHEFKQMKTSYLHVKKLFEEYKRDNELLDALQRENKHLKSILEGHKK
ncbi:MAG: hypothetical protein ACP5IM_01850 [Candidatus Bathyarchaeia archaeon]